MHTGKIEEAKIAVKKMYEIGLRFFKYGEKARDQHNLNGSEDAFNTAFPNFLGAIQGGNANSAAYLGIMYWNNHIKGIDEDDSSLRAVFWFAVAAKLGDEIAAKKLAEILDHFETTLEELKVEVHGVEITMAAQVKEFMDNVVIDYVGPGIADENFAGLLNLQELQAYETMLPPVIFEAALETFAVMPQNDNEGDPVTFIPDVDPQNLVGDIHNYDLHAHHNLGNCG